MPTIKDVAKMAGVAPITASRVINDSGYVSDKTRARVEAAIEELGYVPNRVARSLRSKQTHTLALVLSDITNPFYTTMARGVEDVASAEGFSVILCNTDESEDKEHSYVRVLLQKQVDGFLLVPANRASRSVSLIRKQQVPLVVLDRTVPAPVDMVKSDSVQGAYDLTQHLLSKGHQHIAILSGPRGVSTAMDRVRGYRRALLESQDGAEPPCSMNDATINRADLDKPVDHEIVIYGEYTRDGGYAMMKELITRQPRPTAVFAANNFIAIGAFRALLEANLKVPEDMALVAFDDLPLAFMLEPFLTVAAQPVYEMGKRAAQLLLQRLAEEEPGPSQEILLPVEIVVRRSSGVHKKSQTTSTIKEELR